eukprot:5809017-Amphidinium_carterae.1
MRDQKDQSHYAQIIYTIILAQWRSARSIQSDQNDHSHCTQIMGYGELASCPAHSLECPGSKSWDKSV